MDLNILLEEVTGMGKDSEKISEYVTRNKKELKDTITSLLLSTGKEGMDRMITFLEKSDFFYAPASTKYHSSFAGGLMLHSLLVYCCLKNKRSNPIWGRALSDVSEESLITIALLHDVCKTYLYEVGEKNQKVYSENGSKRDNKGNFDWQCVPYYTCNDKYPLGHAEKSVIFIMKFLDLSMMEIMSIRWHMGFSEEGKTKELSLALKKYPVILALHEADMEASYILEAEPE